MGTITGRNVKIEVALTLSAAVTGGVTDITKAYPPVVTDAAHALANGAVGFFTVPAGMVELDLQAFMVNNQAANTFELPGLDSTDFSTVVPASTTYQVAATWGTISESASYAIGGGAAADIEDNRLHEVKDRNISGNLPAQNVNIGIKPQEVDGAAMQFVQRQAMRGLNVLMKISKAGKVLRVFYGEPSLYDENVSAGGGATGGFSVKVPGFAVKPNV